MKRSVISQFKSDIKAARKLWLPWWLVLPLIVISFGACALLDHFGKLNMALPLLNCAFVFGVLIYLKWGLRRRSLFWGTIALLVAVHAVMIWYIPWTSKWVPAAAIAVISTVDFCLLLWALAAVEVLLPAQSTAET